MNWNCQNYVELLEFSSTLPVQNIRDYFTLMSREFELNFFGEKVIKTNKEKKRI